MTDMQIDHCEPASLECAAGGGAAVLEYYSGEDECERKFGELSDADEGLQQTTSFVVDAPPVAAHLASLAEGVRALGEIIGAHMLDGSELPPWTKIARLAKARAKRGAEAARALRRGSGALSPTTAASVMAVTVETTEMMLRWCARRVSAS